MLKRRKGGTLNVTNLAVANPPAVTPHKQVGPKAVRKVIVTGSREWRDRAAVDSNLDALNPAEVIVGDCPTGADTHAYDWAVLELREVRVFEADWAHEGRAAGPLRNQRMVDAHKDADLGIAFLLKDKPNKGTLDCVRRMRAAGIEVREVWG